MDSKALIVEAFIHDNAGAAILVTGDVPFVAAAGSAGRGKPIRPLGPHTDEPSGWADSVVG